MQVTPSWSHKAAAPVQSVTEACGLCCKARFHGSVAKPLQAPARARGPAVRPQVPGGAAACG
eukprot:5152959-Lingulodinium_polyedra.AAC.1